MTLPPGSPVLGLLGHIALNAARVSGLGCVGILGPLILEFILLNVDFGCFFSKAPWSRNELIYVVVCFTLWIGGAFVGFVTGLISRRNKPGRTGLKWSIALLCLLVLVPVLVTLSPKT